MTYEEFLIEQDYLEHHGIKGQKWGVRRTPEQLGHYIEKKQKSLSKSVNAAKAAKASGNVKKMNRYNKLTKKLQNDIKKAKNEINKQKEKEDSENEEKKQKILKEGSASDVYKHRHEFTPDEINSAIKRINTEQTLASMKDIEKQTKIERGKKTMDTIVNAADSGIKLANKYDEVAKTVNKFMGEGTMWSPSEAAEKKKKEKQRQTDEIVRSGNYETIMNNRNQLNSEQLRTALQIYQTERTQRMADRTNATNVETSRRNAVAEASSNLTTARNNANAKEADVARYNQVVVDTNRAIEEAHRRSKDRNLPREDREFAANQEGLLKTQQRRNQDALNDAKKERDRANEAAHNAERAHNEAQEQLRAATEARERAERRLINDF